MSRFRPFAIVLMMLATVLSGTPIYARGGRAPAAHHAAAPHPAAHRAAPHRAAPRRAAPKARPVRHASPKPNRVAHKPARPASRAASKQVRHAAKPKASVKVVKPQAKAPKPAKVAKAPAPSEKPLKPVAKLDGKAKAPARLPRPLVGGKQPIKLAGSIQKPKPPVKPARPDQHREPLRFVGRSHTPVHHFAHFDQRNHRFWFDRDWWYRFVDYPNSCDDGLGVPAVYSDGDWPINYDSLAVPADVQTTPPDLEADQGLPISRDGALLAQQLDAMDVVDHWLPGQDVNWTTGNPIDDGPGPASNGGEFVAAVCERLNAPFHEPVAENFLPSAEYDWLVNDGPSHGWVLVGDVEAQLLANQGWVVIAGSMPGTAAADSSLNGHTAIVHPDAKPLSEVVGRGPELTLAGQQNLNNVALKDAFPPAAWNRVVYAAFRPRW